MHGQPPREQEQTIKSRKQLLYDDDDLPAPSAASGPRKAFKEYLRETPAAPLSAGTKALLWTAGIVVALLLVATVLKSQRTPQPPSPRAAAPNP